MTIDSAAGQPSTQSVWAPLRERVFLVVWSATLVANIGTWIRDVGAAWLMTSLSPSATAVALVQVASALPIFLFALPGGVLADLVNRRRLLIGLQAALAAIAAVLGVIASRGQMTPALLIAGLAAGGIGVALALPVQQSLTPRLVGRPLLQPAVALGSLGVNVARAIGPALGGAIVLLWGVPAAFFVDAVSYVPLIVALWWWKGAAQPASQGPREHAVPALRAGLRYAWNAPALKRVMARSAAFFLFASAYWALLPVIARRELGGGPDLYGLLLACAGAGAIAGALLLPRLRRRLSAEAMVRLGTAATAVVLLLLALSKHPALAAASMMLGGMTWILVLTTLNVAAQTQLPDWVRGRGLALNLTVFYGAMALGSLCWGQLADRASVAEALSSAAVLGLLTLALGWRLKLPAGEPDLTPARSWPEAALAEGVAPLLDRDDAPVLVTVEYRVVASSEAAFLAALHEFSLQRRRDGAWNWGAYRDVSRDKVFIETFVLPSWREHQRQHGRLTRADAQLQARLNALHAGPDRPLVRHYVATQSTGG